MTITYCYNEEAKQAGRRKGRRLLKKVADLLGLQKGEYDLRWNPGGVAVWGETTLHTDKVYVQYQEHCDLGLLIRTCKGRKDYTGGVNRWLPFSADAATIALFCQRISQ